MDGIVDILDGIYDGSERVEWVDVNVWGMGEWGVGLWSGFIGFDGIRENEMVLLKRWFIWLVIGWCRLMMNFSFIIRKFLHIGSRLWYGSWPYFCADFWYGERVE